MNTNIDNLSADFSVNNTMIDLEQEWLDRALAIGKNSHNITRKFNWYLQALALFTFESWLSIREPTLNINLAEASIFKSEIANILDVVCHVWVGDFCLCIIPSLDAGEPEVTIPRYVIDIPEFTAHFYVLVEVDEELETGLIKGFIDYNRLSDYKSRYFLDKDWNYAVPSTLWELNIAKLLVNLQCLDSNAITLPASNSQQNSLDLHPELQQILPEVESQPLWKKLTWSQAVATVTNPELRNWLYHSLTNNNYRSNVYLKDLFKLLTQQAINLRDWIQTQLEYLEPELTWQMLPTNMMLAQMRNTNSDNPAVSLDNILTQISNNLNLNIPSNAGRAYQEFDLETPLRLYAVTWLISETEKTWGLLLILGSTPNNIPPYGVKLRVSDRSNIIQEQELTSASGGAYLCTHLEATAEDKLLVTITPPDGSPEISRLFEFRF